MLDLAEVTALTALRRTECRGSHWRTDHPGRNDDQWLRHSLVSYVHGGKPGVTYKDVIITDYPPEERAY
jgi:succinate dehydrogenase/fumarate reductase flavoprotein subunit